MKILQVNKFYHITGGVSRYFFEISRLLRQQGHSLAFFSMHDDNNLPTKWSKYFVDKVSFDDIDYKNTFKLISRMIYSIEARNKISRLLDVFKPDIAHIHSVYHHLSPSILFELKHRNIPIVYTVGDYHLISPHHNNLFHNARTCEVSKRMKFYNTVFYKCVKNSYLASFAEALEQYIHNLFGFYTKTVDYFIAPSKFFANKLKEYGIPEEKTVILPYFVDYNRFIPNYNSGDYILYFGRLYPEKGLRFLLEVMKKLPHIRLKIAGKGPEGKKLQDKVYSENAKNIEIISGFIEDQELINMIGKSRFLVFPSQSLEIFGISLLEAYASGKPVVASKTGALPEIVKDGHTGFLFEAGNVNDCAEKIGKLWNDQQLCKKMGKNARKYVETNYNPQKHYDRLMDIYKKVI